MVVVTLWWGERPRLLEWRGFAIALCGLVYLVLPGLLAPSPLGSLLMTVEPAPDTRDPEATAYVIWYAALRGLTTTRAAAVQLSVPVLAALGGVIFLSEQISIRLVISSVTILGGLGLVLLG